MASCEMQISIILFPHNFGKEKIKFKQNLPKQEMLTYGEDGCIPLRYIHPFVYY